MSRGNSVANAPTRTKPVDNPQLIRYSIRMRINRVVRHPDTFKGVVIELNSGEELDEFVSELASATVHLNWTPTLTIVLAKLRELNKN